MVRLLIITWVTETGGASMIEWQEQSVAANNILDQHSYIMSHMVQRYIRLLQRLLTCPCAHVMNGDKWVPVMDTVIVYLAITLMTAANHCIKSCIHTYPERFQIGTDTTNLIRLQATHTSHTSKTTTPKLLKSGSLRLLMNIILRTVYKEVDAHM